MLQIFAGFEFLRIAVARLVVTFLLMTVLPIKGHVVTQLYAEWRSETPWCLEIWFDAGYAVPEWRNDAEAPAPLRTWLIEMGEPGWTKLRTDAERYLRDSLTISSRGKEVEWQVEFPDFETTPPDFPVRLDDAAYFRIRLTGTEVSAQTMALRWAQGNQPSLVVRLPGEEASYLTFKPGDSLEISAAGRSPWIETFRQGFFHVLPKGMDHLLFMMGLFFYQRKWRTLLMQSLAFTAAHTMTLGLAATGCLNVSGNWVEPIIALSLVVVAVENLRGRGEQSAWPRLAIVFGFGLIHGLGFAGALSNWLKPGEGFMTALISANFGVEAAQVILLGTAWILTLRWHESVAYRWFRIAGCIAIAAVGGYWMLERLGVVA